MLSVQHADDPDGMAAGPADLILFGGTIHSSDAGCSSPRAFAVKDGRFIYAGGVDGTNALRGPETQVLDAAGHTVLPGLVDAHLHLTSLGLSLEQVDLTGAESSDAMVERTADFARRVPDEWILGRGWDENRWPRREFPVHQSLSAAVADRPVALTRVDGHALLANARAMAIAGIDESTPDPSGGRIVRDRHGTPTGVFIDAAEALIYDRVPKPTRERLMRAVRSGIAECNRWGITALAEPGCDEAVLSAQMELLEAGEYSIRNHAMISDEQPLIEARARTGPVDAAYDGRLSIRAIKLYADGALGSRGAAMLAPYTDDPSNDGLILTPQERIEAVTERAIRSGFQVCTHAIGDRANRMVLDAYEAVLGRSRHRGDPRLRIEHAQVIAPEDVPRFGKLGIIASMQATHALSDLEWAAVRLGPRRIHGAYPWRSVLDGGAILANGTDAPVESASTVRTFTASVLCNGRDPSKCMTRSEALSSMTTWAAHANFQERNVGSITPGKFADFVVLDRDWMSVASAEIESTRVVATYFAGRCVYGGLA
jgi:predicted amidohydrolase YtcJ